LLSPQKYLVEKLSSVIQRLELKRLEGSNE